MSLLRVQGATERALVKVGEISNGIGLPTVEVDLESGGGGSYKIVSEELISAASFDSQQPADVDTPLQINFGAAQTTPQITLSAAGAITCVEAGQYNLRLRLQVGRQGNPSAAILFGRALINGTQAGPSFSTVLDDSDDVVPLTFESTITMQANDVVTVEIVRDSAGINEGGIFVESSTLSDWLDAPSSLLTITRSVVTAA